MANGSSTNTFTQTIVSSDEKLTDSYTGQDWEEITYGFNSISANQAMSFLINNGYGLNVGINVSENNLMEAVVGAANNIDVGWNVAQVPGLVINGIKTASRAASATGAMKFLGNATGIISIYDDVVKGKKAWQNGDVTGVVWNGLKAGATFFFLAGGGEEVELGWNLASMGVDAVMESSWYKRSH